MSLQLRQEEPVTPLLTLPFEDFTSLCDPPGRPVVNEMPEQAEPGLLLEAALQAA